MTAMAAAISGSIRTVTGNRRRPGRARGAKPPPVHADWPPGMRSPRTCAAAAANSLSASHLAAGSPQHRASLRPPSDQPAISMTALWQAHPAAQYSTALSWTCRRPAIDPAPRRGPGRAVKYPRNQRIRQARVTLRWVTWIYVSAASGLHRRLSSIPATSAAPSPEGSSELPTRWFDTPSR